MSESAWVEYEGGRLLNQGHALGELLRADALVFDRRTVPSPNDGVPRDAVVLFVKAKDVFAWGEDAEPFRTGDKPGDDLYEIYSHWEQDPKWGVVSWLCFRRNEQPQDPIRNQMRSAGSWSPELEALPRNSYWAKLAGGKASRSA